MKCQPIYLFSGMWFACCLLVSSCKKQTTTAAASDLTAVKSLLERADSLPAAIVFAEAERLDGAWLDTFFLKRLENLHEKEDAPMMKATSERYECLRPGQPTATGLANYFRGIHCQYAVKLDSAEFWYARAIEQFEKTEQQLYIVQVLSSRSGNANQRGRTDDAVAMKYRAMEILKNLGKRSAQMHEQAMLANVFNSRLDFQKAFDLTEEPIQVLETERDTANWAYALSVRASSLFGLKNYEEALAINRKSIALRRKTGATGAVQESLYNIGRVLSKLQRWQEALDSFRVVEAMFAQVSNRQGEALLKFGIGEALMGLGRFAEAEAYLKSAFETSFERKQYNSANAAAGFLAVISKKQGKLAEAGEFYQKQVALKDTLFSREKEKLAKEAAARFETLEKEQELQNLKYETEIAHQRNWWIGGSATLIFSLLLFFLKMQNRRQQQVLEKEKDLAIAQNQLRERELASQKLELEANQRNLENYAQMLIERNDRIAQLAERLENRPGESKNTAAKSSNGAANADLDALYQQTIFTTDDWENFKQHFSRVHPGFINSAKNLMPNLTDGELRLVLLLKMGLKNREIAKMLGVGLDSVKKAKYRLHKKYESVDFGQLISGGLAEEEAFELV